MGLAEKASLKQSLLLVSGWKGFFIKVSDNIMSFKAQFDALTTTTTTTTTRFIVLLIHKSVKTLRENNCEKKRAQPLRNSKS